MASSHGNIHSERAKVEQIITEFFTKSLHIILESRSPFVSSRNYSGEQTMSSPSSSSSSSSSVRPRDKWFNLALRDCPAALENLDLWRQSNLEPMIIDVILVQRPLDWDPTNCSLRRDIIRNTSRRERFPNSWGSDQEELAGETKTEKVIERWIIQYESRKSRESNSGSKRSTGTSSNSLYKKSILLLRSLYSFVRLLPAYKLFRDLNSSPQIRKFSLAHRVCSFVEPFTGREEAEMKRFGFNPVDTSCGRLCLSVLYRYSLSEVSSELSTPISPKFITDYVGSPLADPLRRFPSLPVVTGSVSKSSPSYAPFGRRHSWSYDVFRDSPPSPPYSEPRALGFNTLEANRAPPMSLPPHPPQISFAHMKNTSFDEYWPSPTFSTSPSSSSPTHIPGSPLSDAVLRSESAPVNIPVAKLANNRKQNLPPSPPLKGSRLSSSKLDKNSCLSQTSGKVEKLFSLGKDETGGLSGVKFSSNSSPRISFSRSSSRLSFQDDLDDCEFALPFFVDDDDIIGPHSRPEPFDQKGQLCEHIGKSEDVAVHALVRMLKTAPPLRQDFSISINSSQQARVETSMDNNFQEPKQTIIDQNASASIVSSELITSKTTADALEELRGYREMKNLLLSQGAGGRSHSSAKGMTES